MERDTIEFGDVYYVLIRDITDTHYERATLTDFDDLTKLFNKKHFDLIIHKKISEILHLGGNLCLAFLDIDYFNNYIELYGNLIGDDCICSIANIIHSSFHRKDDLIFRYGPCKFAILLSDIDIDAILNIIEKIRLSIRSLKITHDGSPQKIITVSGGITLLDGQEASYLANPTSELIRLADTALNDAKKSGHDMITIKKSEFCILSNNASRGNAVRHNDF